MNGGVGLAVFACLWCGGWCCFRMYMAIVDMAMVQETIVSFPAQDLVVGGVVWC